MRLRNVAGLYVVRLRARVAQELLALIGIAVGVSLLFAALVANSSLTGSFERLTDGVVGGARFQLSARGPGMSEELLGAAQRLRGVETAAAILEVRGELRGPGGRRSVLLVGITPEFAELGGSFTRGFSYGFLADVRAMALPTPLVDALALALGQPVVVNIGGREVLGRLGAKLQESDVTGLRDSPVAIAPLRYVQELARMRGEVTRIFVRPEDGRDAEVERGLRRLAAGRLDVRPADFDVELFRQASQPTSQSTAMFSVFSAMVGFLFAFSAMLLTVPQRRRLIADLDIEGYGPGTILKVLLFDALVLGIAASALGIVLGDQVARRLFDDTPSFLQYAFAYGAERIVTPSSVVLAAAGGLVASCVAVLGPLAGMALGGERRGGGSSTKARRLLVTQAGVVCLLAGIAVVAVQPQSATVGIVGLALLTAAMLCLLPSLLRLLVWLVEAVTREIRSVVPFLAVFDLRDPTARVRSIAVAATGAVAVFGSVALQGAHADLQRGLDRASVGIAGLSDLWAVAPGDANLLATSAFEPPTIARPDGIAAVEKYRGSFLDVGNRRTLVFGMPAASRHPIPRSQLIEGDFDEATLRLREGGWAVLSAGLAREHGVDIGDEFVLPAPVPTAIRVAGLSTNMGWPPGAIVLNADDYARAWGSDDVSALQATLASGTSPAEGARALRSALGARSGLVVQTAADREGDQRAASRAGLARLTQIAALVLVSAMIAMAAAMAGMIWQRRAFIAGMKVEGYGTSEVWRSLLLESVLLMGAGCMIGAVFGLLGQSLLSRALMNVTGFPVVYSTAATEALLSCLGVTAVAVAIVAVFGQRAASVAAESGLRD